MIFLFYILLHIYNTLALSGTQFCTLFFDMCEEVNKNDLKIKKTLN